jgi:anaerobic selenocysteine-containing dehydrogenase
VTGSPLGSDPATACILCECNCGIEVELGGDDGRSPPSSASAATRPTRLAGLRVREAAPPRSLPERSDRLTTPLRRRADGSFEPIDWDTAIREVAERLAAVRDTHGGESIFYYGGGGQGNHLPGAYATATRARSARAIARTRWPRRRPASSGSADRRCSAPTPAATSSTARSPSSSARTRGTRTRIPRARTTLKEIAADPKRTLIVIDPRRTETAELADLHLAGPARRRRVAARRDPRRARQEDLIDRTTSSPRTPPALDACSRAARVSIAVRCTRCDVDEALVATARAHRAAARASPSSRTSACR